MARLGTLPVPPAYRRILIVLLVSGCAINAYLFEPMQLSRLAKGYADFTIFYSAADIVRSGQGKHLYDERVQYLAQRAAAPDVSIRKMALPYNHPPFEALVFLPLSHLPYLPAYLAWAAMNVGFLFFAITRLRQGTQPRGSTLWMFVAALIFFPVFITLFQGQDMLLFLLIVSVSYASIKRDRDVLAGCILGLGLFRPELALPMGLLITLDRGKRFAAGFLASATSVIMISAAIVGTESLLAYPAYVLHLEKVHGYGSIVPADMPNLRGLISLFVHNQTVALISVAAASAAVLAVSAWKIRSPVIASNTEQLFCIAALCSLLISFHGLKHDLALLVIPIVFTFGGWNDEQNSRSRALLLWPVLFFFCTPVLIFLWLRLEKFCLVALVLLAWFWGVSNTGLPSGEGLRAPAGQV